MKWHSSLVLRSGKIILMFLKDKSQGKRFGGTEKGELAIPLLWLEQELFLTGNTYGTWLLTIFQAVMEYGRLWRNHSVDQTLDQLVELLGDGASKVWALISGCISLMTHLWKFVPNPCSLLPSLPRYLNMSTPLCHTPSPMWQSAIPQAPIIRLCQPWAVISETRGQNKWLSPVSFLQGSCRSYETD